MSQNQELMQLNYKNEKTYTNTASNAIGATTSTTLRTAPSHDSADSKYVQKQAGYVMMVYL